MGEVMRLSGQGDLQLLAVASVVIDHCCQAYNALTFEEEAWMSFVGWPSFGIDILSSVFVSHLCMQARPKPTADKKSVDQNGSKNRQDHQDAGLACTRSTLPCLAQALARGITEKTAAT